MIKTVLLVAALIFFLLATFNFTNRLGWDLKAAGLACFVASLLV